MVAIVVVLLTLLFAYFTHVQCLSPELCHYCQISPNGEEKQKECYKFLSSGTAYQTTKLHHSAVTKFVECYQQFSGGWSSYFLTLLIGQTCNDRHTPNTSSDILTIGVKN